MSALSKMGGRNLIGGTVRLRSERESAPPDGISICSSAAAVDRRDRQTDGLTAGRYIDPAPHTMRRSSITPRERECDGLVDFDVSVCGRCVAVIVFEPADQRLGSAVEPCGLGQAVNQPISGLGRLLNHAAWVKL